MSEDAVVIVNGARTPMGGFQGSLASVTAPELGAISIREAVARAGIAPQDVQEVIMGCVLPAGLKQGPARQAALNAGLPEATGCTTINKLCGSGMKATMLAHDLIKAGTNDIMVSGGMESMSNAPYVLEKARSGLRMGHGEIKDHMFLDGLEDAKTGRLMGSFAQEVADKEGLSREAMDEFAITSLQRAQQAIANGSFQDEIVPVTITTRKGEMVVAEDEQPGNANLEKIPTLRAAFSKDGTITAANASSISDGASALVLMRESVASAKGLAPLARIVAHTTQSQHPSEFTLAPVGSLEKLFAKTGWSAADVDLFEINEAFAMVTMLAMQKHNIPHDKVNVHGGACALGHPIGSTGSRIILSLIHALKQRGGKRGVASLCIGGGEATSMAIELI
ncbi:MAG: acetyl-CoA C-acyltransferase [Pseudomonadales bacterium]|jgi:acetyl-CoA C-acetyltransferase|uniref:acetyl-CoA C-acyltransferase n=1 Tax=unclassified Ketobacter TaxID=2639109 RepID=UPI000C380E59|nr:MULTISPECIES: acetyl-CoA C-acyltransferase [unclassified Ketobacter]MAA61060.1 acetyl-CoA C-acyltransferase [Pseudomonadales bacterium]MEC8813689.1 acetyl-CoA C-acyltransferase [Pseudomonadota bacterium]TNC88109.1 MAG: acetyl-CoA C-acyltransferase [Alcanivorax sp.]HAG92569.1 acetyl-CoA C-acetyltransferase [Gammaproteobacteria bacterium]MAQ23032.1 acetyl-CoA C-acyltransferase [Pseudomonadales bacterium]|tara:strand:- start:4076 stop:5257 length:1182 start_codon:yes stop_codon:yes gene_type:complete